MREKRQGSQRRRGGREQRRVPPGIRLEIMDLFDIRAPSRQPIQRGTRPNYTFLSKDEVTPADIPSANETSHPLSGLPLTGASSHRNHIHPSPAREPSDPTLDTRRQMDTPPTHTHKHTDSQVNLST
ncbi:Hypothetical predicted protein [Xyrichtys novacula]|uniref:Uncharacterized protein n=1 Tax=Xyrichtys novacula TaxID=13765 RepID=A0AAV1F642_XYRNO|nr:Hypothetical predicted protein [Xyrichtys novacula]